MTSSGNRNGAPFARLASFASLSAGTALASPYIMSGGKPSGDTYLTPMAGIAYDLHDDGGVLELGFAASFMVAPEGFIPPINDAVHVEGVIFQDVIAEDPTGMLGGRMRWDFHLHPQWSAYAAPGIGIRYGDRDTSRGIDITGQLGGFFHMNETTSLRAEADVFGWRGHNGVRAGVTFRL